MKANDAVIYIDRKGEPTNALVKSINSLHVGYVSLSFQDSEGRTIDVFDVPHMDHESRQESNPDLPTFHINCWKYPDEDHNRAPKDHPMFDHPFAPPTKDQDGRVIPKPRPDFEKVVEIHQAMKAVDAPEPAVDPATGKAVVDTDVVEPGSHENSEDQAALQRAAETIGMLRQRLAETTEGRDAALQALADATKAAPVEPAPVEENAKLSEAKVADLAAAIEAAAAVPATDSPATAADAANDSVIGSDGKPYPLDDPKIPG